MTKAKCAKFLASEAANIVDRCTLGLPYTPTKGALWDACKVWENKREEMKVSNYRNPSVDTDFKIDLFPLSERMIIGILYCDDNEWHNWFFSQPFIEEYGYWNNTDRPDSISAREWRRRNMNWERAWKSGPPSSRAISMLLEPPYEPKLLLIADQKMKMATRVAKCIEPPEVRAKDWAQSILMKQFHDNDVFKALSSWRKWKETDEGAALYAEKTAEITAQLAVVLIDGDILTNSL